MKDFLKNFFDNPQEIFIGACLQFPFIFIIGWWVLPMMLICGIFWRIGGMTGGNKLFRRIGVPLVGMASAFANGFWISGVIGAVLSSASIWTISYGEDSVFYKFFFNMSHNLKKADFQVRTLLYVCYFLSWMTAFSF